MASTTNNMHNLTTLIKRLEAATSRLEDMATAVDPSKPLNAEVAAAEAQSLAAKQPDGAEARSASAPAAVAEPLPKTIEDFDKILKEDVQVFIAASDKLGGLIHEQVNGPPASAVQKAFEAERTYLLVSTKAKRPDHPLPELLTDLQRSTDTIVNLREANRASPFFTHLTAVSEGIPALGWIVEEKPGEFVTEMLGSAQFYGNRVLKEYKDKEPIHAELIQSYYRIFRNLVAYIKQHYSSGVTWNPSGIDALDALKQIQTGTTPSSVAAGAPPPPPPPPPPGLNGVAAPKAAPSSSSGDMSGVFDQINQGGAITSGLRKVDKSEMTHKNPSLRAGSTVPLQRSVSQSSTTSSKSAGPAKRPKPDSMRTKKPPRKELEAQKWYIENFDNTGSEIVEISAEQSHSILISRCNKAVIKINGKCNAISVDNCTALSLIVDTLISSVDVIRTAKLQLQIDGTLPTVMLDQVDGATVYLGKSLDTEVFSSKCTSINLVLQGEDDDKECPVPEQIRSFVKDGVVFSEIVEHAG